MIDNRLPGRSQINFNQIDEFRLLSHTFDMLTSAQCRAARGLLDWGQQQLADAAGVGVATVRLFEADKGQPRQATLIVIKQAFLAAGVKFIDENGGGPGVRLKKRSRPKSMA
jgi:DNA-binding XRE family transcriptional regulator